MTKENLAKVVAAKAGMTRRTVRTVAKTARTMRTAVRTASITARELVGTRMAKAAVSVVAIAKPAKPRHARVIPCSATSRANSGAPLASPSVAADQ